VKRERYEDNGTRGAFWFTVVIIASAITYTVVRCFW